MALAPVVAGLAALLVSGALRWAALGIVALAGAYAFYRYRTWNGRGWRRVHFRAMLAYSGIAARERDAARQAGRAFDTVSACTQLGLLLCGEDNGAAVDVMLSELSRAEGAYLAGLVERHAGEVLRGAPIDLRRDIIARLRGVRLGPQLVIASVIENAFGGAEAAAYAVALASGDAAGVD